MSRLNDLDLDLDIRTATRFYQTYKEMRAHLFNTGRIPMDELKLLTIAAYKGEAITEGKACELLGCDRIDFREIVNESS